MLNPELLRADIERKLRDLFVRMADNEGVSVSERLRLEGYLQAAVDWGLLSVDEAIVCVADAYADCFSEALDRNCPLLRGESTATYLDVRIPLRMPVAAEADRGSRS